MASCNNEGLREESCTKENNEYDSLIWNNENYSVTWLDIWLCDMKQQIWLCDMKQQIWLCDKKKQEMQFWGVLIVLICVQIPVRLDCISHSITMEVWKPA